MPVAVAEPGAGFDSRGLGLRAQKKLLGKMSSKKIAKAFIDDTTGKVLDNTYRILKEQKTNKKEAEKVMKYIIKTVVKVTLVFGTLLLFFFFSVCQAQFFVGV